MNRKITGISASSGISIGRVFVVGKEDFLPFSKKISVEEIPSEILRFEEALIQTRKELATLRKEIEANLGQDHAQIFDAHLLVLEDRLLIEEVITEIKRKRLNVEYVFQQVAKKYIDTLSQINDDYLRERANDIQDVTKRVLRRLLRKEQRDLSLIKEEVVIVAHDLSPVDTASLPKKHILGFATDIGGRTSHTAIIARALGIPAVVGLEKLTRMVSPGDTILIDGISGFVIVNPNKSEIEAYKKKQLKEDSLKRVFQMLKTLPSETKDGKSIVLAANVELPEEIPLAAGAGAQGIGLYRTEYIYLGRNKLPDEEEQYSAYLDVAKKIKSGPVILRTLDLGGDKFLSHPEIPRDMFPFLGWRAIRFCLARKDIFKTQLRAILRASVKGNLKIMFPMISIREELVEAKKILEECKRELKKEGREYNENIEVGAMIEVPSAALISDILAKEVDFFSIGTNDLIQYSLAVDRGNEKVAYLYEPGHPGVLRLIKKVIDSAHKENIWVGMCGEMASSPLFAFLVLGLGIDELSVPPPMLLKVKKILREINLSDAKRVAEKALNLSSSKEVEKFTETFLKKKLKGIYHDIIPLV